MNPIILGLLFYSVKYSNGDEWGPTPTMDPILMADIEKYKGSSNATELAELAKKHPIFGGTTDDGFEFPDGLVFTVPPEVVTLSPGAEEAVLNINKQKYEQTRFHFQNHQNMNVKGRPSEYTYDNEHCMSQYLKCLVSQTRPQPVCAYNNGRTFQGTPNGFMTVNSYCDVYFDNCRRGYRVWRILGVGVCGPHDDPLKAVVFKQDRRMNRKNLLS